MPVVKSEVRDYVLALTPNDVPGLEPRHKLILIALADKYNQNKGYAWPSVNWLATIAMCSERQARRLLRDLEEMRILQSVTRRTTKGRKTSNAYWFPALMDDEDENLFIELCTSEAFAEREDEERRARRQERRNRMSAAVPDTAMSPIADVTMSPGIGYDYDRMVPDIATSPGDRTEPCQDQNRYSEPVPRTVTLNHRSKKSAGSSSDDPQLLPSTDSDEVVLSGEEIEDRLYLALSDLLSDETGRLDHSVEQRVMAICRSLAGHHRAGLPVSEFSHLVQRALTFMERSLVST